MKKLGFMAVAVLLTACGGKGSEYLGQWQHITSSKESMVIERNGDSFLLKTTRPAMFSGGLETKITPATFKDGLLQVNTGLGAVNITHVKDNDTLLMPTLGGGSIVYKRIK